MAEDAKWEVLFCPVGVGILGRRTHRSCSYATAISAHVRSEASVAANINRILLRAVESGESHI